MSRPTEVFVLGRRYTITDQCPKAYLHCGIPLVMGAFWSDQEMIYVRGDIARQEQRETLLHEIIHAAERCVSSLSYTGRTSRRPKSRRGRRHARPRPVWLSEDTVEQLTTVLLSVLTDPRNEPVRRFIFDGGQP